MVERLTIESPLAFNHLCSSYAHGKSYHLLLPKQSSTKYDYLELVVMDLTSPMLVAMWDGHTYALMVVKVSCYYSVDRLLKSKKKARLTARDIITMLKR